MNSKLLVLISFLFIGLGVVEPIKSQTLDEKIKILKDVSKKSVMEFGHNYLTERLYLYGQIEKKDRDGTLFFKDSSQNAEIKSNLGEINYISPNLYDDLKIKFIDFSGAQIKDEIIFRPAGEKKEFADIRFKKIDTTNNILFEDVEFAKTVSFEGSTFNSGTIRNKTITFKNVKFNKDIDFAKLKIKNGVTVILESVEIEGSLILNAIDVERGAKIVLKNVNNKLGHKALVIKPNAIGFEKYIEIIDSNVENLSGARELQAYINVYDLYKEKANTLNTKNLLLSYLKVKKIKGEKDSWFAQESVYKFKDDGRQIPFKGTLTPQDFKDFSFADWSGMIINNTILFKPAGKNKEFKNVMYFRNMQLTTNMKFEDVVFKQNVYFNGSHFKKGKVVDKKIVFKNVVFEGDLDLSNIEIEKGVSIVFDNVTIKGKLSTNNVKTYSTILSKI